MPRIANLGEKPEEGEGWDQSRGLIFGKKCERCERRFSRLGYTYRLPGVLLCFLFLGGTSKYCPACRKEMTELGEKVDKDAMFRLKWFGIAASISLLICLVLYAICAPA